MDSLNKFQPGSEGSGAGANPGLDRSDDGPPGVGLLNLTGRQIGRYLIGQRLGSGGVATVYRAFDQVQGQTVALKVLLPSADEKSYTRFRREALTAGALRHPNIVRILQVGTAPQGEVAYIAMELVEGESLADLLAQRRTLTPAEACALLAPIADALAFAHEAGIIHRDVKPSNILLRPVGRGVAGGVALESLEYPVVPLLSDFGIARALDAPELTSAGRTVGTPAYMAPEQAAGSRSVDGRADIYALGTVLYRCIAGRLPFVGTATQILHAHVYDPLLIDSALMEDLPPDLVAVLRRALAKRPEERFASPADMAAALQTIARRNDPTPHADVTATLMQARPVGLVGRDDPSSTTILVPGLYAPSAPRNAAAQTGGAASGPGGPPVVMLPPGRPPTPEQLPAVTGAPAPGFRWGLWAGAFALLILAAGTLGSLITLSRRNNTLSGAPTVAAVVVLPPRGSPTPSPTPTLRATVPPANTVVIILPGDGTPPASVPIFTLPTDTPLPPMLPTDTPMPPTPAAVDATATTTPTLIPTETPSVTPTATATATATPSPTPSPTLTLIPSPTPTPTAVPTELPTEPPPTEPPPTEPPPTEPPPTEPPPTPTVIACDAPIDPAFASFIAQLSDESKTSFACPAAPPQTVQSQLLSFQNGYMLQLGGSSSLFVDLLSAGWRRVDVEWQPGDPDPAPPPLPPDGLYLPAGIFGAAWQQGALQDALGYALSPSAGSFAATFQEFPGGSLVADTGSGTLYTFLTANQN